MVKQFYKSRYEDLTTRTEKPRRWNTKISIPARKAKEINGRLIGYTCNEEIDQAEVMKSYKPEDFMIENLLAKGVNQQEVSLATLSTLNVTDRLEAGAGAMLNKMDAAEWAEQFLKQDEQKQEKKED